MTMYVYAIGESKSSNTAAISAISIITESNKIITIDVSATIGVMYVFQHNNNDRGVFLLLNQDLLPLLPDQTDIEILKDEICQSLDACGSRIEGLNQVLSIFIDTKYSRT